MKLIIESDNGKIRVVVLEDLERYDMYNHLHTIVLIGEMKDGLKKYFKTKTKSKK